MSGEVMNHWTERRCLKQNVFGFEIEPFSNWEQQKWEGTHLVIDTWRRGKVTVKGDLNHWTERRRLKASSPASKSNH